jgi:chitin disaccharide deacetylase
MEKEAAHRRFSAVIKALGIACLSGGFARAVREASLKTNVGFAGFSYFRAQASYARELQRFFLQPGPRHLVMCHPGHVDAELQTIDPHCERRRQELEVIKAADWLAGKIARPLRLSRSRIELWTPSSTM